MNRKIMVRLLESERNSRLSDAHIQEADDGLTAVEALRSEMAEGGAGFDFILMDFIMVVYIDIHYDCVWCDGLIG